MQLEPTAFEFLAVKRVKTSGLDTSSSSSSEFQVIPLASSTAPSTAVLTQYFTQINGNVTITTNNYYGSDIVDAKFDQVENVFPDDPELNQLMHQCCLRPIDQQLARFIHHVIRVSGNSIVSVKEGAGYRFWTFRGHRWHEGVQEVHGFCDVYVSPKLAEAQRFFSQRTSDPKLHQAQKRVLDSIYETASLIGTNKALQLHLGYLVECDKFEQELGGCANVIGFENGVYDLEMSAFRAGKPEDKISKQAGSTGDEYCIENDPRIRRKINEFFESILPEEDTRNYVKKLIGSCLAGSNEVQRFHVFTGGAGNGKSTLKFLLSLALGNLFCEINQELLTGGGTKASGPTPEIIDLRGKRWVTTSEPNMNSKINAAVLKSWTGGDALVGRKMRSDEMIRFRPMFALVLLTNDIPQVSKTDDGVRRRMCVVNFPVKFVDREPQGPMERRGNPQLEEEVKTWGPEMFKLIVEWYHVYRHEGLVVPESIQNQTSMYLDSNDALAVWWNECVQQDEHSKVHLKTLFESFKPYIPQIPGASRETFKQNAFTRLLTGMFNNKYGSGAWDTYHHKTLCINGHNSTGLTGFALVSDEQ
ncbi:hypothetical protein HDU79_011323 [Rhizoclosmatium sp. JEL0117]|nr:hypothetical protein HDU79_011323 [Rhizoclosmatium sp. JEL0117]